MQRFGFLLLVLLILGSCQESLSVVSEPDHDDPIAVKVPVRRSIAEPDNDDPVAVRIPTRVKRGLALAQWQWNTHLWQGGVVPYDIESHYTPSERSVILSAMQAFHDVTCIRFRPRNAGDKYYLKISKNYNLERCFSYIGRQTSGYLFGTHDNKVETRMKLDPSCFFNNGRGTVMHELMHIIGFYHEHQRDDRDRRLGPYANHYNFRIYPRYKSQYMGAYDANSIMHYNFNGIPWQPRSYFSPSDIRHINTLYKCYSVVLTQPGTDSRKGSVNVQVKDSDSTRRNTIDLKIGEGRSRKNTLVKVNGEVVSGSPSTEDMSNSPRVPRNLSVRAKDAPNAQNGADGQSGDESANGAANNERLDNTQSWPFFNPSVRFRILKIVFVLMCFVDIMHWAYLLRDDTAENPNSWRFYKKFKSFDLYYLVARMFADIFTCVLGLGAAMWTRKPLLTLPCTTIQLLFLLIRAAVWSARSYNRVLEKTNATSEDKVFVICEFLLPAIWALLSFFIVHTTRRLRCYEQLHGYARPPIIVLTVKNDDNDESVQIEIA
ncbi:unnamed protein product [Caenorhabditis bovis]|uniref:Metalloendopeptidase n=1 Tax=Caenorhabditis bovis TaxID=2654633 RepID=A0A8S1EAD3_9PELO|nr:unnamed protein product [Caenorhabditis bovis]